MQIRRARVEDVDQVTELLGQFPPEELTVGWDLMAETFRQIIENSDLGTVLIADDDGQALGVITLSFPTAMRCGGRYTCIEEFIVGENGRGKGIGGGLLKAALAEASARGCYELQVNNPSQLGYPVYLRYGLEDVGKHLKIVLNK